MARPGSAVEPGSKVWIPCPANAWRPGKLVRYERQTLVRSTSWRFKGKELDTETPQVTETAIVHIPKFGSEDYVDEVEVTLNPAGPPQLYLRNEVLETHDGAKNMHDLSLLPLLHEPAILQALQLRFEKRQVYTVSGPMLLAVNPFGEIDGLYGGSQLRRYVRDMDKEMEPRDKPHIYAVARNAYRGMWQAKVPQTVLVSGESGSGKTESTKFVMQFLALAGCPADESMSTVERQVLESIPVLEALGNAKTLRNDNSSRFGKFIELQFEDSPPFPRLVGAFTRTYLLEKIRLTCQHERERSFHIFYQLLAAEAPLPCVAGLESKDFEYIKSHQVYCTDTSDYDDTLTALQALGLTGDEIRTFLGTIMGSLYLGNIVFKVPQNNSEGSELVLEDRSGKSLDTACQLLGVDKEELARALIRRTMKAAGEGLSMSLPVNKAADNRDALARHVYGAAFSYMVQRINKTVGSRVSPKKLLPVVGALDIFGFEYFENNSLEQLLINYTNEQMQQQFIEAVIEREEALYKQEGIPHTSVEFPNNLHIVTLIGGPSGILPLLEEECQIVGHSSQGWFNKMTNEFGGLSPSKRAASSFEIVKHRPGNFKVVHFAGPVEYSSHGCLEKNRDFLSPDLMKCLLKSTKQCIVEGLEQDGQKTDGLTIAKGRSVSKDFRKQLDELLQKIRSTQAHFIRCVKPNPSGEWGKFKRPYVLQQLQYQGVLQAIEFSRAGFPVRYVHKEATELFQSLVRPTDRRALRSCLKKGTFTEAAQLLFTSLSAPPQPQVRREAWEMGRTMLFLKREGVEVLSQLLAKCRRSAAIRLQTAWRCTTQRKRFLEVCRKIVLAQALFRRLSARRLVKQMRRERATVQLQSCRRSLLIQRVRRSRVQALLKVQAWLRTRAPRLLFLRLRASATFLQGWWRTKLPHLLWQRRYSGVRCIQKMWRGHRGRREAALLQAATVRLQRAVKRLVRTWRAKLARRLVPVELESAWENTDWMNGSMLELLAYRAELQRRAAAAEEAERRGKEELQLLRQELLEVHRSSFWGVARQFTAMFFGPACLGPGPEDLEGLQLDQLPALGIVQEA